MNRVELSAWRGDDGATEIGLETGSHTPEMTDHFHDPGLDVTAPTFEKAVLELARQVAITFSDDGSRTVRP